MELNGTAVARTVPDNTDVEGSLRRTDFRILSARGGAQYDKEE